MNNLHFYNPGAFLKPVIVTSGTLKFTDSGKDYHLTGPFLKDLEGKTVLVDAGFEVFRSDKRIGKATPV